MRFDAIVIGAGLGGCSAGAALANAGKRVLILERTDKVGGRCSTQEKNGFKMDLGSHAIYRTDYGPFFEALKRVNMEKEVLFAHLRKVEISVPSGSGKKTFKFNFETLARAIRDIIPAGLLKLAGTVLPGMTEALGHLTDKLDDVSVKDFFLQYTTGISIHNQIDWISFIGFGTPYWETSMGEFLRVMLLDLLGPLLSSCSNGTFCTGYVIGGLVSFPRALCLGIEKAGGEVRTGADVKKVVTESSKVKGVLLEGGEFIESNLVISNAGIKETVKNLVGEDNFKSDYTQYVRSLKPGCAGVCLRLALDKPLVDWDLCLSLPPEDVQDYYHHMWVMHEVPEGYPPIMATSPSNMDPSLAPEGKQSVIVIAPVQFDPESNWPAWEEKLIGSIEFAVPGIMDRVIWHDFLDPGTYLVFGEEKAPAIGIAQCIGQAGKTRPSSKSPIEGLFYVGAEAGMNVSGVATEMATQSGLACADYLINAGIA